MRNNIFKKIIISAVISSTMAISIMPNINTSIYAVETNRSYRYGIGDVAENDDMLKSNDQLILKKYLVGTYELSSSQKKTADIKMDATINSLDSLIAQKCLVGTSGYDDEAIDNLHVAISNSSNIVLKNMRDVIGQYMYQYIYNGYAYKQNTSRTYTINGQTFTGCRTDCSTAVCLALYMSGVLDETKVYSNFNKIKYLDTTSMVNGFSTLKKCTNTGYSINLIPLTPNVTFIQPGDILVYPNGHTSVVASCMQSTDIPSSLSYGAYENIAVYGAGGDFTTVHNHRLSPEIETIGTNTADGERPYEYIIRVSKV